MKPMKSKQGGMMLLEALIALLIFSMGILGVIGLQAMTINTTLDAKYRSDAAFFASQIIAQMWVDQVNLVQTSPAFYACNPCTSADSNVNVQNWVKQIQGTTNQTVFLPGVSDSLNAPVITVTPILNNVNAQTGATVTVTVYWQAPQGNRQLSGPSVCGSTSGAVHCYTTVAQISP